MLPALSMAPCIRGAFCSQVGNSASAPLKSYLIQGGVWNATFFFVPIMTCFTPSPWT